ncbi:MAG: prepilin peptidase [Pseudomonadota bacterium]
MCAAIVGYDILFRRVPNGVLLLALLAHAGYFFVTGHGITGVDVSQSLIGGVVGLLIFLPLYIWRVMGAGDVKFLIVLGALLGLKGLIGAWLLGSLLAGVHAIVFYFSETLVAVMPLGLHRLMQQMANSEVYQRVLNARQGRQGIPYAAYLAIAVIFSLITTWEGQ